MGCTSSRHFPNEIHPNIFSVRTLTAKGGLSTDGKLEVSADQLILYRKGQEPAKWPFHHIRRYGYDQSVFSFECGRRCASGPGIFSYYCPQAEELFLLVQQNIQVTGQEERARLNALMTAANISATSRQFENHVGNSANQRAPSQLHGNLHLRNQSCANRQLPPSHNRLSGSFASPSPFILQASGEGLNFIANDAYPPHKISDNSYLAPHVDDAMASTPSTSSSITTSLCYDPSVVVRLKNSIPSYSFPPTTSCQPPDANSNRRQPPITKSRTRSDPNGINLINRSLQKGVDNKLSFLSSAIVHTKISSPSVSHSNGSNSSGTITSQTMRLNKATPANILSNNTSSNDYKDYTAQYSSQKNYKKPKRTRSHNSSSDFKPSWSIRRSVRSKANKPNSNADNSNDYPPFDDYLSDKYSMTSSMTSARDVDSDYQDQSSSSYLMNNHSADASPTKKYFTRFFDHRRARPCSSHPFDANPHRLSAADIARNESFAQKNRQTTRQISLENDFETNFPTNLTLNSLGLDYFRSHPQIAPISNSNSSNADNNCLSDGCTNVASTSSLSLQSGAIVPSSDSCDSDAVFSELPLPLGLAPCPNVRESSFSPSTASLFASSKKADLLLAAQTGADSRRTCADDTSPNYMNVFLSATQRRPRQHLQPAHYRPFLSEPGRSATVEPADLAFFRRVAAPTKQHHRNSTECHEPENSSPPDIDFWSPDDPDDGAMSSVAYYAAPFDWRAKSAPPKRTHSQPVNSTTSFANVLRRHNQWHHNVGKVPHSYINYGNNGVKPGRFTEMAGYITGASGAPINPCRVPNASSDNLNSSSIEYVVVGNSNPKSAASTRSNGALTPAKKSSFNDRNAASAKSPVNIHNLTQSGMVGCSRNSTIHKLSSNGALLLDSGALGGVGANGSSSAGYAMIDYQKTKALRDSAQSLRPTFHGVGNGGGSLSVEGSRRSRHGSTVSQNSGN